MTSRAAWNVSSNTRAADTAAHAIDQSRVNPSTSGKTATVTYN
jgi:hypothetical protein